MLNSGKKIRPLRDKKINILTLVLSDKKNRNETKNHNPLPPPFKLNDRSLTTELGQKTARCESLRAPLPYVEWDRFVTLAGSKSGLRVTLSYLVSGEFSILKKKKCSKALFKDDT